MSTPTKPYVSDDQIRQMEAGKFMSDRPYEMNYEQGAKDMRELYESRTPTKADQIREELNRLKSYVTLDELPRHYDEVIDRLLSLLADLDGGGDAPPDPDAHITDQEQYLKAKQERAKDVDFDGA